MLFRAETVIRAPNDESLCDKILPIFPFPIIKILLCQRVKSVASISILTAPSAVGIAFKKAKSLSSLKSTTKLWVGLKL